VIRRGLLEARGEEEAPLREAWGAADRPLAWSGLGGGHPQQLREGGLPFGGGVGSEGAEPGPRAPWDWRGANKIAEADYARSPTSEVPLSRGSRDRAVRILAQYKGAIVLLETPEGLVLMDQHAAHERVLYERLARAMEEEKPSVQRLLVPRLLELSPSEKLGLDAVVESLAPLGILLERLSGDDLALVGVPSVLSDSEALAMVLNLASEVEGDEPSPESLRRRILEAVAAERACRSAIKIHHALPMAQMEELVSSLFACDDPYSCPHGRPTLLEMSDSELERRFGRR
jgi:DNA mismatch repair ATPase MutL